MSAQRLDDGHTVVWNGHRFKSTWDFIEAFYCEPLGDILTRLYCHQQYSSTEIAKKFQAETGLPVSGKLAFKFLKKAGIPLRDRSEAGIMKWKLGKMDDSLPKIRRRRIETFTFGSDQERDIRHRLMHALNERQLNADIIIGDQAHSILSRYEVDIPLVLIDKTTQRICKIAVDVDSAFFHSGHDRVEIDSQKTYLLENSGWRVIRIYLDGDYEEIIETKINAAADKIVTHFRRGVSPLGCVRV